jgi:malate dehydrogenase (oxaloacetate-decarboxylating)
MGTLPDPIEEHRRVGGKIGIQPKLPLKTADDLSISYTPGVAKVSQAIAADVSEARALTGKGNAVAVVSDGSAVLGLGNIGPEASLPVMEGKAALFHEFAGIDAYPIVLNTQDPDEIVRTVELIAPGFGGINLEDISAPRCFDIEARLQNLGIPVFHDDQHGTAIVVLAGLINAAKVVGKEFGDLNVVIVGAGAAGTAVARILSGMGEFRTEYTPVNRIDLLGRKGALTADAENLSDFQKDLLRHINPDKRTGTLDEAIADADVFIGVSGPGVLTPEHVRSMADKPIVFAMANPDPEIDPAAAHAAGVAVMATGRSDYPNQVNNVLAFPGIFKGALESGSPRIDDEMKVAAALALAGTVTEPTAEQILPSPLDKSVVPAVAQAVSSARAGK